MKTHGQPREEDGLRNHVDLVLMLDIVDLESGSAVAGGPLPVAEPGACMPGFCPCLATAMQLVQRRSRSRGTAAERAGMSQPAARFLLKTVRE